MKRYLMLLPLCLCSCATLAKVAGVTTQEDLNTRIAEVKALAPIAGPWGDLMATGVAALLVGANHAYRNKTRKKALFAKTA